MNQYEILYRHFDMPTDYRGYTHKWGNTKDDAIRKLSVIKPDKQGRGRTKKGAVIQILEVNEI
jgi:hypothetical protein